MERLLAKVATKGGSLSCNNQPTSSFHFRHYPIDENDIAFLLCAMNGHATHLISYDSHLLDLDIHYPEIIFSSAIPFLNTLRQIQ
jgi:predicted nucleic acid-binding protein